VATHPFKFAFHPETRSTILDGRVQILAALVTYPFMKSVVKRFHKSNSRVSGFFQKNHVGIGMSADHAHLLAIKRPVKVRDMP
jgi:hypothetical protein